MFQAISKVYVQILAPLSVSLLLTPVCRANIVGTGTQNFYSTANAYDYVTVHSSRTIGQGNFHLNLFLNGGVNTLPYFDEDDSTYNESSRGVYNDSVIAAEGSIGFGILDNWDIGLNIPAILYQDISAKDEPHGEFSRRGITEFRISTKIGLLQTGPFGLAAIASTNLNAIESNPYGGKGAGPGLNAELAGDVRIANVELASNIGYRVVNSGEKLADDTPVDPHKNQFIASAAIAYMFRSWDTKWVTEVFSSSPTSSISDGSDRHTTRAEVLTGLKFYYLDNLFYHAGIGSELRHSVASADWRGYGGVSYIFGNSSSALVEDRPARHFVAQSKAPGRRPDQVIVVRDIHFKFDSAEVTNAARSERALDNLAKALAEGSLERVIIEGHTCSLGSKPYNQKLSQRRANRIRSILISKYGFDAGKLRAVGVGEGRPVATNQTDAGRRLNRRVEFQIFRNQIAE